MHSDHLNAVIPQVYSKGIAWVTTLNYHFLFASLTGKDVDPATQKKKAGPAALANQGRPYFLAAAVK